MDIVEKLNCIINFIYYIERIHQKMTIFETDDVSAFLETLSSTYDSIYISLGGKCNERYVNGKTESNAAYQMIPRSLRGHLNPFIIIIDNFDLTEAINANRQIVEKISIPGDILFVNCTVTAKSVRKMIKDITRFAELNNIPADKYAFCNYIRFMHPNQVEYELELLLPDIIQRRHNKTIYSHGFYQWYGYHTQLYNTIYCYKTYHLSHLCNFHVLSRLFSRMGNVHLSASNSMFIQPDDRVSKTAYMTFLKNNYDITSSNGDYTKIMTSYLISGYH